MVASEHVRDGLASRRLLTLAARHVHGHDRRPRAAWLRHRLHADARARRTRRAGPVRLAALALLAARHGAGQRAAASRGADARAGGDGAQRAAECGAQLLRRRGHHRRRRQRGQEVAHHDQAPAPQLRTPLAHGHDGRQGLGRHHGAELHVVHARPARGARGCLGAAQRRVGAGVGLLRRRALQHAAPGARGEGLRDQRPKAHQPAALGARVLVRIGERVHDGVHVGL